MSSNSLIIKLNGKDIREYHVKLFQFDQLLLLAISQSTFSFRCTLFQYDARLLDLGTYNGRLNLSTDMCVIMKACISQLIIWLPNLYLCAVQIASGVLIMT